MAGAILAGGRSSRMGGQVKAFLPLAGKPLLQHVADRVSPQVQKLVLSVEQQSSAFDVFGMAQLPDPKPGSRGPLGGLLSVMRWLQAEGAAEWLLLAPCDAPFVPLDLAERLYLHAAASNSGGAVVHQAGQVHPVFSLWHNSLLQKLEQAVITEKMAGFKQFLRVSPLAGYEWPEQEAAPGISPFFNINDQPALDRARLAIRQQAGN
jgi:molybdopterin-guanine dinucleotide biosynthesis protein A